MKVIAKTKLCRLQPLEPDRLTYHGTQLGSSVFSPSLSPFLSKVNQLIRSLPRLTRLFRLPSMKLGLGLFLYIDSNYARTTIKGSYPMG